MLALVRLAGIVFLHLFPFGFHAIQNFLRDRLRRGCLSGLLHHHDLLCVALHHHGKAST